MQKKILYVCIALLPIIGSLFSSEIEFNTQAESYRKTFEWSNALSYRYNFLNNWQTYYQGEFQSENDDTFDRDNSMALFTWGVTRNAGWLRPSILFDSRLSKEEGSLEAGDYRLEENRYGAGLMLGVYPIESIALSSKLRYLKLEEEYNQYGDKLDENNDGYESDNLLSFAQDFGWHNFQLDSHYRLNQVTNDEDRNYSLNTRWDMTLPNQSLTAQVSWDGVQDEINKLSSTTDTQKRDIFSGDVDYRFSIFSIEQIKLGTDYRQVKNRFDQITTKNYDETNKSLRLGFTYPMSRFRFEINSMRELNEKDYQSGINTLDTDYREFEATIHYSITERDSMVFYRSINLRQTDAPKASIRTDNDRLQERMNIGMYYYLYDRVHTSTLFYVLRTEQVYLYREMSGNNRVTTSYNLQPEISIAYGNRFQVRQFYAIRADYEDYEWSELHTDHFYRRLEAGVQFIYDESPDMQVASENKWGHLHLNRTVEHPFTAILGYEYENSASGDKEDDYYNITLERENHEISLEMIETWDFFSLRSLSIISWSTFTEIQQRIELDFFLSDFSYASFSIHPVSRDFEEPEWKLNFDISMALQ